MRIVTERAVRVLGGCRGREGEKEVCARRFVFVSVPLTSARAWGCDFVDEGYGGRG